MSVIVPNYNHGKYLGACLSSILAQSFQPLEIIVLDDASTDNSVEVVKEFAQRNPLVRLVQNEKNLGVMPNLNKGVQLARGDYIYVCSADDEVFPGLFEKSLGILIQHPDAGLSCGASKWHDVASGLTWHMASNMADRPCYLSPGQLVDLGRSGKLLLVSSSVIWRRKPLCEVGSFHPELRWHADWYAVHVPAFRHGVCYIPEPLSITNILPKSFYTAGVRKPEHKQVLLRIIELLSLPENADVRRCVAESGALSLFAMPMLRLLVAHKQHRSLMNGIYLRRAWWRIAELTGKKVLPAWMAKIVLKTLYSPPKS